MRLLVATALVVVLLAGMSAGGPSSPDLFALAVAAYAHGNLPAARSLVEQLQRDASPAGGRAAYLLGVINLLQKRFPEGAAAFARSSRALPILADHALYYQAAGVFDSGDFPTAAQLYENLLTRFPDSSLRGLALFWRAESLAGARAPQAADAFHRYLEAFGDGRHAAQAWFDMGKALEQQGRWADASQAYRRVRWGFEASPYAGPARVRIAALGGVHTLPPDATPPDVFFKRGLLDLGAGDFGRARMEFQRALAMPAGWILADDALYNLGALAYEARRFDEAAEFFRRDVHLRQIHTDDSLYYLERIALVRGREADALAIARTLAHDYPQSSLAARSLYAVAEVRAERGAILQAEVLYREAAERFPSSRWGSQARWEIGWLQYRLGRWTSARDTWLRLAGDAPASDLAPAGLYWSARAAVALGRTDLAQDAYRRAATLYPDTYYGQQAAARLGTALRVGIEPPLPDVPSGEVLLLDRFRELDGLAQTEDATRELEAAVEAAPPRDRAQVGLLLSQYYAQQDQVNQAILKAEQVRAIVAAPIGQALPLALWEALYPLPDWPAISQAASRAGVDPYLVAGVIREESRFDAQAVSSAGAYGLMQLMPGTARSAARVLGVPPPDSRALVDPATNVALGATVLADELQRFGRPELALAAYNAGPIVVRRWLAHRRGLEPDAIVEDFPYAETRGYVKTVLQSAAMYRWLYRDGHPSGRP